MEKGKNFSLNEIEDFGIVEVSTKKSTGKKRNDYVVSRTEAKKTGTKKTLSVVEDYARFDFRANKKAVKSVQEEAATQKKESAASMAASAVSAKTSASVPSAAVAKVEVKSKAPCRAEKAKAKAQEPVVIKEKTPGGSIKLEKSDLERHIMRAAEASERFETDDAANRVVLVARMGSLFG